MSIELKAESKSTSEPTSRSQVPAEEDKGLISDSKKKTLKASYPTRCQKIGEIDCFFLQSYKNGKVPLLNIGPSKCPCLFLIIFGMFCLFYMLYMVHLF